MKKEWVLRNLSYELHWSEWVHQWAESNTRMSTPLQYLALSSIRSKCKILLFWGPFFNSTSSGAQLNSIDVSKSCIWILYTSVTYNWRAIMINKFKKVIIFMYKITIAWKAMEGPLYVTLFLPVGITPCTKQTRDSHWFLIIESPTSIILFLLILPRKFNASNLYHDVLSIFSKYKCEWVVLVHLLPQPGYNWQHITNITNTKQNCDGNSTEKMQ